MLGYAIRIVSDSANFYNNHQTLLNKFLIGCNLDEAKFFYERDSAEECHDNLNKFMERVSGGTPNAKRTIRERLEDNDPTFKGFEIVEVDFCEIYFVIAVEIPLSEDELKKIGYVREIFFDSEENHPVVAVVNNLSKDVKQYTSHKVAKDDVKIARAAGHILAPMMTVHNIFINPTLMD